MRSTKRLSTRLVLPALWLLLLVAVVPVTQAQIPDEFTNLKVLSKDMSKRELMGTMRSFASALGVRCNHCHPGPENLQGMDFATDELEAKRIARTMMKMTQTINETHLPAIQRDDAAVACVTCHRGLTDPRTLKEILTEKLEAGGATETAAMYRELREEHYGGGSYDFGPGTLNSLSEGLARSQQVEGAIELMKLNVEFHPDAAFSHLLLGQIYAANGDTALAIESVESCLKLDPENRWAKQSLEALKKKAAEEPEEKPE